MYVFVCNQYDLNEEESEAPRADENKATRALISARVTMVPAKTTGGADGYWNNATDGGRAGHAPR